MFRTELHITPPLTKISHAEPLLSMGSCFSDNMGRLLYEHKFNILSNPFGVIFNPVSNHKLLSLALKNSTPTQTGFLISQDVHLHYDFHSQLGSITQEETAKNITSAIADSHNQLKHAKWLIMTWGTAIVYELKDNGEIVANCHKVPANQFNKRLLSQKEIIVDFENLLAELPKDINVMLTVSPVRHLKETLELNSVSKSILRIACHTLAEQHDRVYYFPGYELMLDDLRDYRFYKSDMLHPSDEAIQYIWDKFCTAYFDSPTLDFIEAWQRVVKAIHHKPFNPNSEGHQKFVMATIDQLKSFKNIDTVKEITMLEDQLLK